MIIYFIIAAAVLLIVFGLWAKLAARNLALAVVPGGKIVYSGIRFGKMKVLQAPQYHLRGSPDYVVRSGDEYIPVEIKSSKTPRKLFDSDLMQVVAYAVLVEAEFGKLPPHGIVCYPDKDFTIKITDQKIEKLRRGVETMRASLREGKLKNAPKSKHYCPTCYFIRCPEREIDQERSELPQKSADIEEKINSHEKLKAYSVDNIRQQFPSAYKKWTEREDMQLKEGYKKGKTINELSYIFRRKKGAIRSRLKKLGIEKRS